MSKAERLLDQTLPFRARVTRQGAMSFELASLFGEIPIGENGEGTVRASFPASEIDYYAGRFLALGTDMVVEAPPELIAAMRLKAQAVSSLYEP